MPTSASGRVGTTSGRVIIAALVLAHSVDPSHALGIATNIRGLFSRPAPIRLLENEAAVSSCISAAAAEDRVACIEIYANWCQACKKAAPKYQRLANRYRGSVEFNQLLCAASPPGTAAP